MKMLRVMILAVAALIFGMSTAAPASEDVLIVYDASGSMWGQIDGVNKIVIARDVMADLVNSWPEDINLGLVTYGARRKGDCSDIQTLIEPGPVDRQAFIDTVKGINPKGKTPIAAALKHAADVLKYRENKATVVLISDGLESCHGDPCAVAKSLETNGIGFTAHVVGFDLNKEGNEALSCIADNTGGIFVPASNAQELEAALQQVQKKVEEAAPDIDISAPKQVKTGETFDVSWSAVAGADDQVMLVPEDTEANRSDISLRVGNQTHGQLTAPDEAGDYQVRYVAAEDGQALASAPVQVVPSIEITAPEQVQAGAPFKVNWSDYISRYDIYTIVPVDSDEGAIGHSRHDVGKKTQGSLTAPADPGLYEVRYVLKEGKRTLASTPVEVTEPEVSISAPEQVQAGAPFKVSWSDYISRYDIYTIVPVDSDEGAIGHSEHDVGKKTQGSLTAPADPGLYEVRYVLKEGKRTLASTPVEVTEPEVSISAPEQVQAGAPFKVSWSDYISRYDIYTIVPVDSDEGAIGHSEHDVGKKTQGSLTAPDDPGLYEVRYVLKEGKRTLASTPVEVVEAEVEISAPDKVTAGSKFDVSWSQSVNGRDYVQIVPKGHKEGDLTHYIRVGSDTEGQLKAPDKTGLYEVRYTTQGGKTLASTLVEVTEAEVEISAPDKVTAGSKFDVSWSQSINGRDYVQIVPKGHKEGDLTHYIRVGSDTEGQLTAPGTTGLYEVRYTSQGGKTLASTAVEITAPEVSIDGPDQVRAGDTVHATWSAAINSRDFVQLVPMGYKEGSLTNYTRVGSGLEADFEAPDKPGLYELRYVLNASNKTLASHKLEVVAKDAAIGAIKLSVPDAVSAGDKFTVSWSGGADSDDQRVTLAKADDADFTWAEAHEVDGNSSQQFTAPDKPGYYEIRYLDVGNGEVLGRVTVNVK